MSAELPMSKSECCARMNKLKLEIEQLVSKTDRLHGSIEERKVAYRRLESHYAMLNEQAAAPVLEPALCG
jgi:hypothetical protein